MRRPLVAIAALMALLCACLFGFAPTRAGVQCPTAPVQTLVVKDCCGRIVKRAPRPGDRTFVQCRCSERKAASATATVAQKVTLFLVEGNAFECAPAPPTAWTVHGYAARGADWSSPPALRPPTLS